MTPSPNGVRFTDDANSGRVFTDADLKRLKEMGTVDGERWIRGESKCAPLDALIARLEAAENLCGYMAPRVNDVAGQTLVSEWRKCSGKDK